MTEWCRYTDKGRERVRPREPWRIGRLVSRVKRRNGSVRSIRVLWNGRKVPTDYYPDFIEVYAVSEETPS